MEINRGSDGRSIFELFARETNLKKNPVCTQATRQKYVCVRCELFQVFLFELSVRSKVIAVPVIKILEKGYKIK